MTASLHTKPRNAATVAPSTGLLVLQPPRHLFIEPKLLTPGEYRIGSAEHCDLVLAVAGVAAEHALLTVGTQQIQLQALPGALTWVNDFPVAHANLRRGDRISFGPLTWTLRAATSDDLLAHLPSQESPPAQPSPAEESTPRAMLDTLDAALAQIDVAQSIAPPAPVLDDVSEQSDLPEVEIAATVDVEPQIEINTPVAERCEAPPAIAVQPVVVAEVPPPVLPSLSEIAEQMAALQAERASLEEMLRASQNEMAVRRASLEEREARINSWEDRLIAREQILDQRQTELEAQRTALDHRETALTEERLRLEQVAASAQSALAEEIEKQSAAWLDWEATQRKLSAELNAEFAALHEVEAACNAAKAQFALDQTAWKETYAAWQQEHAEWDARRQEQQQQLAQWEAEAQHLRDELARERSQLAEQRSDLQTEACQRSSAHRELLEARQEVQRERRLLAEQQSVWMADREAEWVELRERRRRLDADEREIAELRRNTEDAWAEAEAARQAAVDLPAVAASPSEIAVAPSQEEELASETVSDVVVATDEEALALTLAEEATVDETVQAVPPAPELDEAAMRDWMESSFDDLPAAVDSPPAMEPLSALTVPSEELEVAEEVEADFTLTESLTADTLASPEEAALIQSAERFHQEWLNHSPDEMTTAEIDDVSAELPAALEETATDPVPAEFESEPAAAEPETEASLHAQLAKMFGLPEDFGHQATNPDSRADDAEELTTSAESNEVTVTEESTELNTATIEEESPPADSDDADEDDSWRTQLALMLTEKAAPAVPASDPPPVLSTPPEKPQPVSPPPPPVPTPPPQEEDSIAAYMERLLARNRMGSFSDESAASPSAPKPAVVAAASVANQPVETDTASVSSDTEPAAVATTPTIPLPLPEPRQRVDKDEVRAALQSFRKVANQSARSAIAKHSSKALRGEVSTQGVLAGLAGIAAGAYLLPPLWGGTMQPLPGAGCLIAAGWMTWQMQRSLNRLKNWNPSDRLEIDDTDARDTNVAASLKPTPDEETVSKPLLQENNPPLSTLAMTAPDEPDKERDSDLPQ